MADEELITEEVMQDAEYSPKSDFSKGEVVRNQVAKCCEIRSKEMKEGYFNYDKMGNRIYVPDTRREFISAVKALRALLSPEILRSGKFKKKEIEFKREEEKIFKEWAVYPENKSINNGKPFIPEIGASLPQETITNSGFGLSNYYITFVKGKYDSNVHGYWSSLIEIYDKLFYELNNLVDENQYFKKGRGF